MEKHLDAAIDRVNIPTVDIVGKEKETEYLERLSEVADLYLTSYLNFVGREKYPEV